MAHSMDSAGAQSDVHGGSRSQGRAELMSGMGAERGGLCSSGNPSQFLQSRECK